MNFGPANFQQAGFQSAEGSIVATAVVGVVNELMISIPLIDKAGRRRGSRIATNGTLFIRDFVRNSPMMIHANYLVASMPLRSSKSPPDLPISDGRGGQRYL
jgi:hypothetical protein